MKESIMGTYPKFETEKQHTYDPNLWLVDIIIY